MVLVPSGAEARKFLFTAKRDGGGKVLPGQVDIDNIEIKALEPGGQCSNGGGKNRKSDTHKAFHTHVMTFQSIAPFPITSQLAAGRTRP